ncbi:hypothetical protein ACH5RR_009878 [Cinchona calisaya]|uniref:Uncharacterized protein n=1 Tax=Cinchona calisaya TaxID=153742 RepID=A0ABD3AFH8_9GENT
MPTEFKKLNLPAHLLKSRKKAYITVSGGKFCPCEDVAAVLGSPKSVCKERRFKIFDQGIGSISGILSNSEVPVVQAVYASVKGLIKIGDRGG